MDKNRLIFGITGATGVPIAEELLRQLRMSPEVKVHLIISKAAELTIAQEGTMSLDEIKAMADVVEDNEDLAAGPSSGSFPSMGMVIVPCSMKTVAGIASGYSDNLILRAADVMLKERRKLVLVAREAPLGTVHLRNLYEVSQLGAVVIPPMMSFYAHPKTIDDMVKQVVSRVLDQWGLELPDTYHWSGMDGDRPDAAT